MGALGAYILSCALAYIDTHTDTYRAYESRPRFGAIVVERDQPEMGTTTMRSTDTDNKCYFRSSERVFRMNERWYFAAREGDQGPFDTEAVAKQEIARFVMEKQELANFQAQRERNSDNIVPFEEPLRKRELALEPIVHEVLI